MGTIFSLFIFSALLYCVVRYPAPLKTWTMALAGLLIFSILTSTLQAWLHVLLWVAFLVTGFLNISFLRKQLLSAPMLNYTRKVLPPISQTEQEAIDAGSVWWEAELFKGNPNWDLLHSYPKPELNEKEQAYVDGPVEELCQLIDDWQITHELNDLPTNVWQFMLDNKLFAINIPESYGGLEFSPVANSAIVSKVASRSGTAGVTVMVPNSLGPAELLLHYGTKEQQDHYLPRLANGIDIPCFALTSPTAGSDAGAIPDKGIICKGEFNGEEIIGIRLNWEKRYITLGPVATLLGLAFKAYDPEHLVGEQEFLGITCALIPTNTEGVTIGQRHYPLNAAFQNGPNFGKDVFIPLDWIIGGQDNLGNGWRMLMGSLAAGRGISLPATGVTAAKMATLTTGAYARVREQFGISIDKFEGIGEALARMGGMTYMLDAGRRLTLSGLAMGEQPSVVSAIAKYYLTEAARHVVNDGMDIHAGRAICMGPNNYMARSYQQIPIAITVEGANILTRTLIIFGQGAMRCHPYLLDEVKATSIEDKDEALEAFDKALFKHIGYSTSNAIRSFVYGISGGLLAEGSGDKLDKYYRDIARYSAAFAFLADIALLYLGGNLKRKEKLSGRFADAMIHMFMASAVLKRYRDTDQPEEDLPLVEWALQYNIYQLQMSLDRTLRNFPNQWLGRCLRVILFPLGRRHRLPSDDLGDKVSYLITRDTHSRQRLTDGMYIPEDDNDVIGRMESAFIKTLAAEPAEKSLRKLGVKQPEGVSFEDWIATLTADNSLEQSDADLLLEAHAAKMIAIQVDHFEASEQFVKYKD